MSRPLVSVIIPTYNRKYALGELLESLVSQSEKEFEVIVINDHGEPVDQLRDSFSELELKFINLKVNQGHVHARNEGISHAKGEFIMLCDDDDLVTANHIEKMLEEIKDADLVYSDVEMVEYKWEGTQRVPIKRMLFAYELDKEFMRKFSTYVSSGCLYRRSIHNKIGIFDVEMKNYWDWDFILRVLESFKVKRVAIASVLYAFSSSGDNQSANLSELRNQYLKRLCDKHRLGNLPQKNFFTLLEEPEVMTKRAESQRVWDGEKIGPRLL
ncbi:glycosyl transferase [Mycobacteroides abscessus subsp. abscessus]|nr:glycosyl transferase [Mycobacteroides abscessus subsp. abscessus]